MGLSTHVLDTMHGCPARGMAVALYRTKGPDTALVKRVTLDDDGRSPGGPLIPDGQVQMGTYRLVFEVAAYFRSRGVAVGDPPFLGAVTLDFGIAEPAQHYHVPLLVSPWSYSTYRGS